MKQLLNEGSLTLNAVKGPEYRTRSRLQSARGGVSGLSKYGYGTGRPDYSGAEFSGQEVSSQRAIELEARKRGLS
ncbi:hypothetical protein VZG28_05165 [Synechococcus elongatus IITB4]|uniref:hypothetical protein n=1 Tax=Synechococcus elongatus TaxID=32046 RepID=UPI0030D3D37C